MKYILLLILLCLLENKLTAPIDRIYNYNYLYEEASFINRSYETLPSKTYKNLAKEYSKTHYNIDDIHIKDHKIIVIHSTATKTLEGTINVFNSDYLIGRSDIKNSGDVNVSIHFIVDRDGTVYSYTPITVLARHVIGLNYTSIGIENVGFPDDLTEHQLLSNIKLVNYLKENIDTIEHVIGHFEYNDKNAPHYSLMKNYIPNYTPRMRYDPSKLFVDTVREGLEEN